MDSTIELLRSTVRILLWTVISFSLVLQLVLTATWPLRFGWNLLQVTLLVVSTSLVSLWLVPRHFALSHAVWQVGLAAATVLTAATFHCPEALFPLTLLPMLATMVIGWQAGLAVDLLLAGLLAGIGRAPALVPLSQGYRLGILLGGTLQGIVGWAATRAFVTMTEWSFYSYRQAEKNLAQVREHRQQLARLAKSLDQAYHQLERTNASLVAAWRTAHEAERLKADFVANVSHELRTPLNLIIGYSEVIVTSPESYRGSRLPSAYRRDINAVYNSARHLLALVDDVLELGRIEADQVVPAREAVEPAELVAEVEELVRDYVTAKGLELQVAVEEGLPVLWIDRLRIRQVLLNLVVNAARFTERGHIRIWVAQQAGEVVFGVEDTGRGIDPHDLPHVFEPFHTAGSEPGAKWHSGSGLGLPISKKFVELHGGWMEVESTLNRGTTFTASLPCRPYRQPHATMRPTPQPGVLPAEREHTVVVVPDDPLVVSQLQRHMEGLRFVGADGMDEGLALAEEMQATAVVASSAELPPVRPGPTLVVTLPWPSSAQIAANLGAHGFLAKPVSRQQLFAAIDRLERPVQRILLVDDDPELVNLFRRMLRARLPVQNCLEAYSAQEALQSLAADRPDLVLLDLSMPGEGGRTVLEHMAADPALRDVPVIIVSGVAWSELQAHFEGPIRISREGGFGLREVIKTLEGIFNAATPARPVPHPAETEHPQVPSA